MASAPSFFVGREYELEELARARDSGEPELIALYGRRRIGKTYLIRTFFADQLCFELSGVREASLGDQLKNFAHVLGKGTGYEHRAPADWPEAFRELTRFLEGRLGKGRTVVFLDELPWLAGRRSGFLPAFEHFWNSWASAQKGLIVVICGSAASWMIAKVLHQKGGLHNRVTRSLGMQPFRLHETEAFLRGRGIQLDRRQLMELTMALGGVPYYLNQVRKGFSAAQNIDHLFFGPSAMLRDEFDKLFASLFEHHERHLRVIRALAAKQSGLSRQDLAGMSGFGTGGNLTTVLSELEVSGFICRVIPFGHEERDPVYRLIDELTLFHLRWLSGKRAGLEGGGHWAQIHGTPAWQAWSGYGFESLCLKHAAQIKQALGIAGVQTEISSWRYRAKAEGETGAQIDLLIDRKDGVINVCEMKFSEGEFVIVKKYAAELRHKLETFRRVTGTRKSLFLTMVTARGLAKNELSTELVQNEVTADALFER